MFRSKKDVDAHVRDVFSKCKLESERLKLCFGIAKQYSSIRDFDSARRYLDTYLNSNPTNPAEAHKLMGDILQELGDLEKALESYKISYSEGQARDSLNRVCDLLSRGVGSKETAESKKKWFDMQKSTANNNPLSAASSTTSSPVVPRRAPIGVGGPPKTGFYHSSFTNGNTSPLVSPAIKANGSNVDLQLRYLERRFDDGLGKILDQNTLVLEQMMKMKEDVKDLSEKVELIALNQENMQIEIRELKEKQKETQALTLENQQSRFAMMQIRSVDTCKNCDGRPAMTKPDAQMESAFQGLNAPGKYSFADLAKNNSSPSSFSFANTTASPSFNNAGVPLFTTIASSNVSTGGKSANTSGTAEDGDDDFVPTAEFQPVIPLPPLVDVKKGDENENTIAEYRTKLYRYISETKEWKERGVGNVKLLQSKTDEKKCRVVMWREKVGKLACNFSLFPDIKVTNYQNNPKVLCWKCQDFTEEPAWETFTLRFGNEDNCTHFKTEMERLAKMTVAVSEGSPGPYGKESPQTVPAKTESKEVPLSQLFKKPEGSWSCDSCYCSNTADVTSCVACQTCRPGYENVPKLTPLEAGIPQPKFSFGFPAASTAAPTFNFGFSNPNNSLSALADSSPATTTTEATTAAVTSVVDGGTPKKPEGQMESAFQGLNLAGKFSFADLAKNNSSQSSFSFANTTASPSFVNAGAPLFTTIASSNVSTGGKSANTSATAEDGDDDFVPTAEFQPVIPLPPLVEIKKGDENENTIAEYRAKLYRYISETKEWKERGVGNVKLLQSKTDEKKCRVVMWREKVGKLACNFSLFPDIQVTNYQNNPKVLCWKCQDFTEEPAWETFTLRFGNEDNCAHFKTEMERLAKMTVAASEGSPAPYNKESPQTAPSNVESKDVPLSQLFKKPEGSWSCDTCYCSNTADVTSCMACQTCRPGYENVPETTPTPLEAGIPQPKFSFGFPAANTAAPTFNFGFNNTNNSLSALADSSIASTTPETATAASISVVDGGTPKKPEGQKKESAFQGLNLAGKFSFADLAKNNSSPTSFSFANTTVNSSFNGAGAPLFSTIASSNVSTGGKSANTSATAEDGDDDFVPTAEFQPVIPLPPLVEIKKGDENENTIAEYRAKLYRYISETKEWKERGVGNVKLLQSKTDEKKCRVVMWREKVGKLACNFSLFPDIKVTNYQNNPKVLCWKCQDFTEEPAWETFTLRFGNEDNCAHFKTEMERLAKMTVAVGEGSPAPFTKELPQTVPSITESKEVPLSQLFKKPEGSWSCDSCYCSNTADVTSCVACQTCRPGYENVPNLTPLEAGIPQPKFSFGFPAANTAAPTFNFGFSNPNNSLSASADSSAATTTAVTSVVDGGTPKKPEGQTESVFQGLNLAGKFSFADLAKNNSSPSSFSFANTNANPSFNGAGAPLFTTIASSNVSTGGKSANISGTAEDGDDDFVPTAEFQPVIPLPPLVEVKKGDEDENTIAEYRAKLYRYISETKEWKERGVGNVKLLQSKTDEKKCRVVMWREKIGKLACNFSLFPDIKITNYQNNPKVLCWKCQDFTEEPAWETFTLRFGNEDNCAHFKTEMERLAKMTVAASEGSPAPYNKESPQTAPSNVESKDVPLSQLFKKPEGSWSCDTCYCSNTADVTSCMACQTCRPGYENVPKPPPTEAGIPQPKFSFGFPASGTSAPTFNFLPGSLQVTPPQQSNDNAETCSGCVGCDPDTYQLPEISNTFDEETIELPLSLDSSHETPSVVSLDLFTRPSEVTNNVLVLSNSETVTLSKEIGSADTSQNTNKNNSLSNFSFSYETPEKPSPNSFQFKTSTFSFKSEENNSIFGGGGSIFTPPAGGNPPGSTPSPFVSPFGQSLINYCASPQSASFGGFSQQLFNQQSPTETSNVEDAPQQREEQDEYEDVDDDEEEDEVMLEEEARVYILDDVNSGESFVDKGDAVVRVLYDGESYCARLVVMVDGGETTIAEHLVATETILEPKGDLTYEWTGICNYDAPIRSRIKAVFNDEEACKSFSTVMKDSLEFAEQAGITEAVLLDDTSGGYEG